MKWVLAGLTFVAGAAFADHGTQGVALPVEVRKGQPGLGGWMLMILPENELYVGTYRVGDFTVDQVSYAVPFGSYERIKELALREIAGAASGGAVCDGYLRDTLIVVRAAEDVVALEGACADAGVIAARDVVADAMRALVP